MRREPFKKELLVCLGDVSAPAVEQSGKRRHPARRTAADDVLGKRLADEGCDRSAFTPSKQLKFALERYRNEEGCPFHG